MVCLSGHQGEGPWHILTGSDLSQGTQETAGLKADAARWTGPDLAHLTLMLILPALTKAGPG